MCPQISCFRRCKVTLIAFVWLFSTVCFQMWLQSPSMCRCKVTLVAFIWLVSTVHFQMCPQATFHRGCILTLVALVWTFSFIICVCQGNVYIISTFTEIIIFKILIHHHQVGNAVLCVVSGSNWENEDCRLEERTMKVKVKGGTNMGINQHLNGRPDNGMKGGIKEGET